MFRLIPSGGVIRRGRDASSMGHQDVSTLQVRDEPRMAIGDQPCHERGVIQGILRDFSDEELSIREFYIEYLTGRNVR